MLPGMDGTGKFFPKSFFSMPNVETKILSLPEEGTQSYEELAEKVIQKLPEENFVLLAESFSGPLAALIASRMPDRILGVIFVATFLTSPGRIRLRFASQLPLKAFLEFPILQRICRWLLFGKNADQELFKEFLSTVNEVPEELLIKRLKAMLSIPIFDRKLNIPAIYLRANRDKLVPATKGEEFHDVFRQVEIVDILGPHFLLQVNPDQCRDRIIGFIESL